MLLHRRIGQIRSAADSILSKKIPKKLHTNEREREPRPAQQHVPVQFKKRIPPPNETNAEIFYYKKQIDAHTPMVIVLLDGEEIEGTIEWYDRGALKVNRKGAPNLLILKRNIKYIYKADERVEKASA